MLFSSPIFIFIFLPAAVILYYILLLSPFKNLLGPFICIVSLLFYAWGNPEYLAVILLSIIVNFGLGKLIALRGNARLWFMAGIILNLAYLGYFKYTNFSIWVLNKFVGASLDFYDILLPVGISFFTFQQIAWLADLYTQKLPSASRFVDYCCFITFFPQLMAGPIVHHQEMIPQFASCGNQEINWENIFNGLVAFNIGLAKKVLIADNLAPIVMECFENIPSMTFMEALCASLCYTFQLYFDFSGYCDMAIGCALFFNIILPINFNSPYRAQNIQEFWRRWHMTLSRWLRDYLYIPLGGNRHGLARTTASIMLTFILGGLWHGAAWTFVAWGALHGFGLAAHRAWQKTRWRMPALLGCLLTFLFVNLAWIIFRAPGTERIGKFVDAFLGYNGFNLRVDSFSERALLSLPFMQFPLFATIMCICAAIIFLAPNTLRILGWPDSAKLCLAIGLFTLTFMFIIIPASHPQFIYSRF